MSDQLTDKQFSRLAELIEGHVGIKLPPAKRTMVEGRLRKRTRALGMAGLDEYGRMIMDPAKLAGELDHLVDCVTTNKTDFFREPEHFQILRDVVIPKLLSRRSDERRPHLKLWSAAASIGAEAYTIAMVLADMLNSRNSFDYSILGTDVCREALDQGKMAVYPSAMMEPVPQAVFDRYVMRSSDPKRDQVRMVPELRRHVRFKRLNLMDANYPVDRDVDVIFCRNILIYFAKDRQKFVVDQLSRHLRPGGYLFLGHSESFVGSEQTVLRQVASTVFQKD